MKSAWSLKGDSLQAADEIVWTANDVSSILCATWMADGELYG